MMQKAWWTQAKRESFLRECRCDYRPVLRLQARCSAEYAYLKDALSQPNATWKLHEFGDERAMRTSSVDAISG